MGAISIKTPTSSAKGIDNVNVNFSPHEILLERDFFDDPHFTHNINLYISNPELFSLLSVVRKNEKNYWEELDNSKSLTSQSIDITNDNVIIYISAQTGITKGRNSIIKFDEKELKRFFKEVAKSSRFLSGKNISIKNIFIQWTPFFSSENGVKWNWSYLKGEDGFPSGLTLEKEKVLYKFIRSTPLRKEESIEKINIFSLAACIYGISFWQNEIPCQIYDFGAVSKFGLPIPSIKGFSEDFNNLLKTCLDKNPNNRPSGTEISRYLNN